MTFTEQEPPPTALSREAALEALRTVHNRDGPPSTMQYGVMYSNRPATGRRGEEPTPRAWEQAVWVISYPDGMPHFGPRA